MSTAAALASAYAHGPGKQISVGPSPKPASVAGPLIPLRALPKAVARLLSDVLTPMRWEQWNQYNDHRAYPSPRAAYLVDVVVCQGAGRWPLDPVRRALIGTEPPGDDELRLDLVTRPERLSEGYGEFRDALAELEAGHVLGALVRHAERLGFRVSADFDGVTLRPGTPENPPSLPPRSSGIGPRGLAADPRPLPHSAFRAFVETVDDSLGHRLAVHNVEGVPDGWYHGSELVEECDATGAVQATYGHSRANTDVASMNLVLVTTADVPAAVADGGPNAYRNLLRAAGGGAQRVCETAAEQGMFCRPVRSVEDPALEAAAGAPLAHSLLYVLLAGRQRVCCFPYDLTPLERL